MNLQQQLVAKLNHLLRIASHPSNMVRKGQRGLIDDDGTPRRCGKIPANGNDEWVDSIEPLYHHLRAKVHAAGWETPVAIVVHVEEVDNHDGAPIMMRIVTVQFDYRGHLLPGQLTPEFHQLIQRAAMQAFGEVVFEGYSNLLWGMHVGEPVPVKALGGANAGNVSMRTPVRARISGDHDDPLGGRLARDAEPEVSVT